MRLTLFLFMTTAAIAASPSGPSQDLKGWSSALDRRIAEGTAEYLLVSVWSPFCEPCGEEVREMNLALQSANQEQGRLAALGIPVQSRNQEVKAFLDHFHPQYPQWLPDSAFREAFSKEGAVPWTLLYDKDKNLLHQWRGKITSQELLAALETNRAAKKGNP